MKKYLLNIMIMFNFYTFLLEGMLLYKKKQKRHSIVQWNVFLLYFILSKQVGNFSRRYYASASASTVSSTCGFLLS